LELAEVEEINSLINEFSIMDEFYNLLFSVQNMEFTTPRSLR